MVAEGRSDDEGRFQIAVPPGDYVIEATGEGVMSCAPVSVSVKDGEFTDVTVLCDTGVRTPG